MYVKRDDDGRILAVSRERLDERWEHLADESPELSDLHNILLYSKKELELSDAGLVRVLEDLIDLLIEREIIRFTDFPPAAQEKLLKRQSIRSSFQSLNLLPQEDDERLI